MEKTQIEDINAQILKLRTALPIWGVEANDLIELARNAERAAAKIDERTMQRMRGLMETTTGGRNTLLYWEEQDAAPDLSAVLRVLRGSLDAMRKEAADAAASFDM